MFCIFQSYKLVWSIVFISWLIFGSSIFRCYLYCFLLSLFRQFQHNPYTWFALSLRLYNLSLLSSFYTLSLWISLFKYDTYYSMILGYIYIDSYDYTYVFWLLYSYIISLCGQLYILIMILYSLYYLIIVSSPLLASQWYTL